MDPVRDWLTLVTATAIAFVGIVVWNMWAFDTVVSGGVIGTPVLQAPKSIDRSSIEDVRAVLEKRAEEKTKYDSGIYRYADPSQ